ncbi:hypothetical protein SAY87_021386 [Trapa incisa]|uniref:Uncharacterized protein n=1 Tax=Trapa incisa TaxID=236973 RepID=A0AAN7JX15_9MYRT|nr:hypothetical protein SAY87_021386 [Trapa incisa]
MAPPSGVALLISVTLVLLLVIPWVNGDAVGGWNVSNQREFDYFKLTLLWPGTACRRTRHCCPSNACCQGSNSPEQFTIHGLWPDYNDGTWPACCTRANFEEKEISTLVGALRKYWPSYSCGSASTCHGGKGSFWAHEWEKHGTCSSPVVGDEYNYFLTTLNVYFKYNVTRVLFDAGYVPSNTEKYPLGGVITAIQNAFHTTPEIACSNGAVDEIRLCLYKDFRPRECALQSTPRHGMNSRSSCPKYVSLPAYTPRGDGKVEMSVSSTYQSESM